MYNNKYPSGIYKAATSESTTCAVLILKLQAFVCHTASCESHTLLFLEKDNNAIMSFKTQIGLACFSLKPDFFNHV